MRPRRHLLEKVLDDATVVACAVGEGVIREEVWEDESGKVIKYNLAFINHFLWSRDNGRVLGYDNAHDGHHRHFRGKVEPFEFVRYQLLSDRFYSEVEALRGEEI